MKSKIPRAVKIPPKYYVQARSNLGPNPIWIGWFNIEEEGISPTTDLEDAKKFMASLEGGTFYDYRIVKEDVNRKVVAERFDGIKK